MKSSVPATRSSTAVARGTFVVRDKFEKPRGSKVKADGLTMELDDDSYADISAIPALPSFTAEGHVTEHRYIGSPGRSSRPAEPTTPLAELQARAVRVRAALENCRGCRLYHPNWSDENGNSPRRPLANTSRLGATLWLLLRRCRGQWSSERRSRLISLKLYCR